MKTEILEKLKQRIPGLYMVILGGSQVEKNGAYKDTASDYDLLALTEDTTVKPVSLNNFMGCADVIVRHPGAMAFEIAQARYSGCGSVLRTGAIGQVLYDPHNWAAGYQSVLQNIYADGPERPQNHAEIWRSLFHQSLFIQQRTEFDVQGLPTAAYALAHEKAQYKWGAMKGWKASGKILARFLYEKDPDQHRLLSKPFTDLSTNYQPDLSHSARADYLRTNLDKAYHDTMKSVDKNEPDYIAWECREDPKKRMIHASSQDSLIRKIAWDTDRYTGTQIIKDIKTSRVGNPTNEYDFTLAKSLKLFGLTPQELLFLDNSVSVSTAFDLAMSGKPDLFKDVLTSFLLTKTLWPKEELFIRNSPASFTLNGYDAENFPKQIAQAMKL